MSEDKTVVIFTDGAAQRDDVPPRLFDECPRCGAETEEGFGLNGGGYGPYSFCSTCGVVGKVQFEDEL